MLLNVLGDFNRTLGSIAYNGDYAHLLVSVRAKDMPQVFERVRCVAAAVRVRLRVTTAPQQVSGQQGVLAGRDGEQRDKVGGKGPGC